MSVIPRRIDQQVDAEHGATDNALKRWIEKNKLAEAKLDFNSNLREFNGHVNASWDDTHLYKDVMSATAQFIPDNPPGFHGMYSQAMVGSTIPGRYTGEFRVIAIRTFNDNKPDAISDSLNRPSAHFTQMPEGLDDGGKNKDLIKALRKMMGGHGQTQRDQDIQKNGKNRGWDMKKDTIDAREFGRQRAWRATV